ncbi:MAG: NfeD family protein [Limnoraphis robusta]|uniref:Membrane protein implicated in regulation of membrane protease activity n=1 Tax=Limnoraphis robusta CS-951 TaxID=1637645 RepID=A0A0F5YGB9_9CYAN|nr:NfeD family protein [Limnoraphis robusta]KKD37931.1 membrane protein implicated in regulation of membrane protease activity [Limnoraphis robusta CS-951]
MLVNPTIFWLVAGLLLCLMELFVPTAFVELMMGFSALIVAGVSLIVPYANLQVLLWMILSLGSIVGLRRWLPNRRVATIEDAQEAETLTEILPGQTGRVLYEGNSWRARLEAGEMAIAPHQRVIVIGREGNTLIVISEKLLNASE